MSTAHSPLTPSFVSAPEAPPRLRRALPAVVVHDALRRELRLAAPLVRGVGADDHARAELVAAHLGFVLRLLEEHHHLEDDLVWPPLQERAPAEVEPLIATMIVQHATIEHLAGQVSRSLTDWADPSHPDPRETLAGLLVQLVDALAGHLDLEEREVLPLAERHLRAEEWDEIGRRADAANKGRDRLLALGMLQLEGDPAVLAAMLADAPRLVRMVVPRAARRTYRRHALAVHGTATPAPSSPDAAR